MLCVRAVSLLSPSKGFDFSQRRTEWGKNIETAAGAGGFQTYLEENGLFKCEYVASKSKQWSAQICCKGVIVPGSPLNSSTRGVEKLVMGLSLYLQLKQIHWDLGVRRVSKAEVFQHIRGLLWSFYILTVNAPHLVFAKSRPQLIKDFVALLTLVFQQQMPIHFKMHFRGNQCPSSVRYDRQPSSEEIPQQPLM